MAPDAALCLPERNGARRLHFFKNHQVGCWDIDNDTMLPDYPRDIEIEWPGLLQRYPGINLRAALYVPEWGEEVYFLFEGQREYVVWDLESGRLRPRPVASTELLPCAFPAGDFTPFVAMTALGERVIYGFHGTEYVRWTIGRASPARSDAAFPRPIADDWKDGPVLAPRCAVYVDWPNRSSAHSNRKIYFFMGNLYLRWDVPSNTRNYRLDIPSGWKGWPVFR
jgi:hypothetical protein